MDKRTFREKTEEFSKNLHVDFVKKILVFDNLQSTNSSAKDLARTGAEEGTIVLARTQSQGRGRFDRIWQSPEGGVYLSIILRPKISLQYTSLLPLVAALAVVKSIRSYGLPATIKWPNDVRVNGKKVAGILLESEISGDHITYVIVGIGINLNTNLQKLPREIRSHSTSLLSEIGAPIAYHDFIRSLFRQFDEVYKWFNEGNSIKIIGEWKTSTDTLGRFIRVQTSTELLQGTAFDIDQKGFLLLRTDQGEIKKILSGDCLYFEELDHT
ncbi:MAG: biotin--[acetyl-CoA-carboxylase] ligase [Candidatus Thermoplasmatota archaeon]|nr:biotin--[acetyl-CoA-carboxylase] ligase [Candidatus Thermoplasmatota archaeon]